MARVESDPAGSQHRDGYGRIEVAARNVTQRGHHEPDSQTMCQRNRNEIATVAEVLGRDYRPDAGNDESKGPNELGHCCCPEITVVHIPSPDQAPQSGPFPAAPAARQRFPRPIVWSPLGRGNGSLSRSVAMLFPDQPEGATVGAV